MSMFHMRSACLIGVMMLCGSAAVRAETLETLEAKLAEQWKDVNAFKSDITVDTTMALGPIAMTMKAAGTMEFKRFEESGRFRTDLTGTMGASIPGMGEGMKMSMLSVYDGEFVYIEMGMMGQKQVQKKKPDASDTAKADGGKSLLNSLKKLGDVTLLPDEQVDGKDAYVVEVKYNAEAIAKAKGQADRTRMYIDKNTGMQIKMEGFKGETRTMSMTYSNYDLKTEIPDERFTYTPPAGVRVIDADAAGAGLFGG
ncbi:MAG: hypothetical protein AMXMBFR84_48090 [Candidatus Hydrogenedentota bacterium]